MCEHTLNGNTKLPTGTPRVSLEWSVDEVTGSCTLLDVSFVKSKKSLRILIDCGSVVEKPFYSKENSEFAFDVKDVDYILLTHAHVDHVGKLPVAYANGCNARILATSTTRECCKVQMDSNLNILSMESTKCGIEPTYTVVDVNKAYDHIESYSYDEYHKIGDDFEIMFIKNAHSFGASMIYLKILPSSTEFGAQPIEFLFTGDFCSENLFYTSSKVPEEIKHRPLHIMTEATYGSSFSWDVKKEFEENIQKAVDEKKVVIVPVTAYMRMQEISWLLKSMESEYAKQHKEFPKTYFVGNLGIQFNDLAQSKKMTEIPAGKRRFYPRNKEFLSVEEVKNSRLKGPCIVVCTSGMCSFGPSQTLLSRYLESDNTLIHFTMYCAPNTLGYRVKQAVSLNQRTVAIDQNETQIRAINCEVKDTSEFSRHARADEILEFLNSFTNIKSVLVNHGDFEQKDQLTKMIIEQVTPEKHVIKSCTRHCVKLTPYGIQKVVEKTIAWC